MLFARAMRQPQDRWLDELDRQLCDPYVIDDPSLGTVRLVHRTRTLRQMRGAGRERALRALMREIDGLATVYPRRFDLGALSRMIRPPSEDVLVLRDSEATLISPVPI